MLTLPNQWSAMHSGDFASLDLARTVAVLPLGATEQHGPHLPLGVDTRLVQAMVEGALPRLKAGSSPRPAAETFDEMWDTQLERLS